MTTSPLISGKRMYNTFNDLFTQDPNIDELGIILITEPPAQQHQVSKIINENESVKIELLEVPFVLQNHKLAVGAWCLKPFYEYSTRKFAKTLKHLRKIVPVECKT